MIRVLLLTIYTLVAIVLSTFFYGTGLLGFFVVSSFLLVRILDQKEFLVLTVVISLAMDLMLGLMIGSYFISFSVAILVKVLLERFLPDHNFVTKLINLFLSLFVFYIVVTSFHYGFSTWFDPTWKLFTSSVRFSFFDALVIAIMDMIIIYFRGEDTLLK